MEKSIEKQVFSSNFQVLLSVTAITCILWLVQLYWKKKHFFRMAALIPNHEGSSIFGLAPRLFGKSLTEKFFIILEAFRRSPDLFKVWFGIFIIVGVSKPEHMEIIMNHNDSMEKGPLYHFIKPFVGEGLISAPVVVWKRHRKLISPSFNQRIINSFIPVFTEKCDVLIGNLEKLVGQRHIDIFGTISKSTLGAICETAMGLNIDDQTNNFSYVKLVDIGMESVMKRVFNVFYHSDFIFKMTPHKKTCERVVSILSGLSQRIIAEKKSVFEQKTRGDFIEEKGDNIPKTFLEHLIEMSHTTDAFTDQELQDEVNTFITAGSETTAVALSFCCIMLGMHPRYQQTLYEEAIEVLGPDRYADKEDIPKLKFTGMFIKETLRLFPVVPIIFRQPTRDIKIDDLVIPKDSIIALGIMPLHRSPKYWEDPLKFNPYRFLPGEISKKHPYSFLSFSGGPRNCIGYRYAMMNVTLVLSKLVRKFKLKTEYKSVDEILLHVYATLRPSEGYKISMDLRE